jgi:hypothetical protein
MDMSLHIFGKCGKKIQIFGMKLYSPRLLKEHFFKKRSEGKKTIEPKTEQEQTVTLLEKKQLLA